jgi:hypothetical protein
MTQEVFDNLHSSTTSASSQRLAFREPNCLPQLGSMRGLVPAQHNQCSGRQSLGLDCRNLRLDEPYGPGFTTPNGVTAKSPELSGGYPAASPRFHPVKLRGNHPISPLLPLMPKCPEVANMPNGEGEDSEVTTKQGRTSPVRTREGLAPDGYLEGPPLPPRSGSY